MKKRRLHHRIPAVLLAMIMALSAALPVSCGDMPVTAANQTENEHVAADAPMGPAEDEHVTVDDPAGQMEEEPATVDAPTDRTEGEQVTADDPAVEAEDEAGPVSRLNEMIDVLVDAVIDWAAGIMFPDMDPDEVRRFVTSAYSVAVSDEFQALIAYPEVRELMEAVFEKTAGLSRNNPELAKKILLTAGAGESVAELLVYLLSHRDDLQELLQMTAGTELGQLVVKALDELEWSYQVLPVPPAAASD